MKQIFHSAFCFCFILYMHMYMNIRGYVFKFKQTASKRPLANQLAMQMMNNKAKHHFQLCMVSYLYYKTSKLTRIMLLFDQSCVLYSYKCIFLNVRLYTELASQLNIGGILLLARSDSKLSCYNVCVRFLYFLN